MKKNIKPFCNYNDLINKLENEKKSIFFKNNKINKRNIKQLLTEPRFRLYYFE